MKALNQMFESILSDDTMVVWTPDEAEGTCSFAGPRIQTVWGWGG